MLSSIESDEYSFDNYDMEDISSNGLAIRGIAMYSEEDMNFSDESDEEDLCIKPSDNLLLIGKGCDSNFGCIEVKVFNYDLEDFYPHHEQVVSSCPLAVDVLSVESVNENSNFIVIGQTNPAIEMFDLDVINAPEPVATFGTNTGKKKKGHIGAVLDLAINHHCRTKFASVSEDKQCILWDIEVCEYETILQNAFSNNIECMKWCENDAFTIMACSKSGEIRSVDFRRGTVSGHWSVKGEAVQLVHCKNSNQFLVGTGGGAVYKFDNRSWDYIWKAKPHESHVTGMACLSSSEYIVTSSIEGSIKSWAPSGGIAKSQSFSDEHKILDFKLNPDVPFLGCAVGFKKRQPFLKIIDINSMNVT